MNCVPVIYRADIKEPNHCDFETLQEAIAAHNEWEKTVNKSVAVECPVRHCKTITKVSEMEVVHRVKWDNDPYNPRQEMISRTAKCPHCGDYMVIRGIGSQYFKSVREIET